MSNLPDISELENYQSQTLSILVDSDGTTVDHFGSQNRIFTSIINVPELVKYAFISAEDKNFYNHNGYDILGLFKALFSALKGERLRGASTITQQVTKNFLLSGERSFERKIKEIILATRLEKMLNKNKILEIYLNEIFLGSNSYGVTTAAETYFAKKLSDLSPSEAAYLASLPKAPNEYHPLLNRKKAISRRNFVLKEMAENEFITAERARYEQDTPLLTVQSGDITPGIQSTLKRDYFSDEVRRRLSVLLGENYLFSKGLSVHTSLKIDFQNILRSVLQKQLTKFDTFDGIYRGPIKKINAGHNNPMQWRKIIDEISFESKIKTWRLAVVVNVNAERAIIKVKGIDEDKILFIKDHQWIVRKNEIRTGIRSVKQADQVWSIGDIIYVEGPATSTSVDLWQYRQLPKIQGGMMLAEVDSGRVLAVQGGFSFDVSTFNRATQAFRAPGSLLDPFVYASLLNAGFDFETPTQNKSTNDLRQEGGYLITKNNVDSMLFNDNEISIDTLGNQLLLKAGKDDLFDYFNRFDLVSELTSNRSRPLRLMENSLLSFFEAYLAFANNGLFRNISFIDKIIDSDGVDISGNVLKVCALCDQKTGSRKILTDKAQSRLTRILEIEMAKKLNVEVNKYFIKNKVYGTAGMSLDFDNYWFIGYRNNLAFGCYIGYDKPHSLNHEQRLSNYCVESAVEIFQKLAGTSIFD